MKKTEIAQTKTLDYYDDIIDRGKETFLEVGNALVAVKEGKLYTELYATFNDYTELRHGFSRQRAHQLIQATEIFNELSTRVDSDVLPTNEMQVRTLAKISDDPDEQARVWDESVATAPIAKDGTAQISSTLIEQVAAQAHTVIHPTPPES